MKRNKIVKTVEFEGLKCQGKKELQYIKECKRYNRPLPKKAPTQQTPFGEYTPDFEYTDRFIEIKSLHTFMVSTGFTNYRGRGVISDLQWRKIKWVAKNIKPIDIIIYLSNKEAIPILEVNEENINIIIKGGKLLKL